MSSASGLFHNRLSRFGRSSLELGGEEPAPPQPPIDSSSSSSSSNFHRIPHLNSRRHRHGSTSSSSAAVSRRDYQHHNHRRRLDIDGCDPLSRRSPLPRNQQPPRHLLPDRESGWLGQGSSPSASEDVNDSQSESTLRGRLRSNGNNRLPGTVLLARERLLQRLRGVSLSANRRRNRASSSSQHTDLTVEDDIWLDVGDWENEISGEWLAGTISFTDILSTEKSKRPPGLTQEALDRLKVEIFSKSNNSDEEATSRGLEDCSICLENFLQGDKLINLTCGHRFHFYCLDPWVRICGDCPNCRKTCSNN